MSDAQVELGREELIRQFVFERVLRQDQAGRRLALVGTIRDARALLVLERAAFPSGPAQIVADLAALRNIQPLGSNDLYHWFLAATGPASAAPALKLNLFYPATEKHLKKYSPQRLHFVRESPERYARHVRPYLERARADPARLQWMHNILSGVAEADRVIYRSPLPPAESAADGDTPFILLPDLNWDQTTLASLHLLVLIDSPAIWTLRDLRKAHIPWLERMRARIIAASRSAYPALAADEIKIYAHYLPTYFQFHLHVVHVALDAGVTQATGKAVGFESLIAMLNCLAGEADVVGLQDVEMAYVVGEQDEIWDGVWRPLLEEEARE